MARCPTCWGVQDHSPGCEWIWRHMRSQDTQWMSYDHALVDYGQHFRKDADWDNPVALSEKEGEEYWKDDREFWN